MHLSYPLDVINAKRDIIEESLPKDFKKYTPQTLERLFELYDKYFFNSQLSQYLKENNIHLELNFGHANTYGGFCSRTKECEFKITLSRPVFDKLFIPGGPKVEKANGVPCTNKVRCLMTVFEHELVHLLIFLGPPEYYKPSHGPYFKKIASNLFGHTDFKHALGFGKTMDLETAKAKIKIGDVVRVLDPKTNKEVKIKVTGINQTARGRNFKGYFVDDPNKVGRIISYSIVLEDEED